MNRHRTIFRRTDVPRARIAVAAFEAADRRQLEDYAETLSRENAELGRQIEALGRQIARLERDARSDDWRHL